MLAPDTRTLAADLLRPPEGYELVQAVITTYSLDLEAMLALPLAVIAHSDHDLQDLLGDPLGVLEALREVGRRIHVFVDAGGIAVPKAQRGLYAMLENSIHPVSAPGGGVFHPKVWFAHYRDAEDYELVRIAVLSRNLTFDRSWDVALVSEGEPYGKRVVRESKALGQLLTRLPELATQRLEDDVSTMLDELAGLFERTPFPCPEGLRRYDAIDFQIFGLGASGTKLLQWESDARRMIAIAPFLSPSVLAEFRDRVDGECILIGRQDILDALPAEKLQAWTRVKVLSDALETESEDGDDINRPIGLHAKLLGVEHGWYVTWYLGSANLTDAAFRGHNVEVIASVTGRRSVSGIDPFLAGFEPLCQPYRRVDVPVIDAELAEAERLLDKARQSLLGKDVLRLLCAGDGEFWTLTLDGDVGLPAGVEVSVWPVSLGEEQARVLKLPLTWNLPMERLTVLLAFRLRIVDSGASDLRLTLKLPAEGLPEGRVARVLRSLIDSPERLLQFLRALLGGLAGVIEWSSGTGDTEGSTQWFAGLGGETLLEDLVRIASRDPERLAPVRRLFEDLRATEEGRKIIPDDLYEIWSVVDEVVRSRSG